MAEAIRRVTSDAEAVEVRPKQNYGDRPFLSLAAGAGTRRRAFLFFARPPLEATLLGGTMRLYARGAWAGAHTLTFGRVTATWKESRITWNNAPATTAQNEVAVVVTDLADGEEIQVDLTPILADVVAGGAWFGIRITVDTAGVKQLHSSQAADPELRPELDLTWAEGAAPPDSLRPSGGRAVSLGAGRHQWRFRHAESEEAQSAAQLQISTDPDDFTAPVWDSGWVATGDEELDLAYNLLSKNQSDLETDTAGWTAGANTAIARSVAQAQQGAASLELTAAGAGDISANTTPGAGGIPVTPGKSYAAASYLRPGSTARDVRCDILFYDAAEVLLATEQGAIVAEAAGAWTRASVVATTPAGAAAMAIRPYVVGVAAGEVHYADAHLAAQDDQVRAFRPGYDETPDGATRHWRGRARDGAGEESDWSEVATFRRVAKGTLAITNPPAPPNNTVEETTPPLTHAHTPAGAEIQESVEHVLFEDDGTGRFVQQHKEARRATADTSWVPPAGLIRRTEADRYRGRVRLWDDQDREDMPGDPAYIEAERIFTFAPSAVPTPPSSLVAATDHTKVHLDVVRVNQPDFFALVVDGVIVEDRIDPAEVSQGGGNYRITYWGARPGIEHTYEVQAVVDDAGVLKHSTANPEATVATDPVGIWIVVPDEEIELLIMGHDQQDMGIGETSTRTDLPFRRAPVTITSRVGGYEGTVSGVLVTHLGVAAATWRDRLLRIKGLVHTKQARLVFDDQNVPVEFGQFGVPPHPLGGEYAVSIPFHQTREFTFAVAGD